MYFIKFLAFILLVPVFSQTKKIEKLLNDELNAELKSIHQDSNYNFEKFEVISDFLIDDNQKLSLKIRKNMADGSTCEIEQSVNLEDVLAVGKDIQVIFDTNDDAVKIQSICIKENLPNETLNETSNMFFTHLTSGKNNDELGIALISAFKQLRYTITKNYWYD